MSTAVRDVTQDAGIASLVTNETAERIDEDKSKIRYLYNAFDDIDLVGPDGLRMRLGKGRDYYGLGLPGETLEDYQARKGNKLRRCIIYPINNIEYDDSIFNFRDWTKEDETAAQSIINPKAKLREVVRYAGICAADFVSHYSESHGARVLDPLTGMDGPEKQVAAELFRLVQPKIMKLTNLRQEMEKGTVEDRDTLIYDLTHVAPMRIKGADLPPDLAAKAEQLRVAVRNSVMAAIGIARRDWGELHKSLNDSSMGRPGKSSASAYDEQLAYLLGEAVPSSVARPSAQGNNVDMSQAIANGIVLAQQQLAPPTTAPLNMDEARQILADIRAEREALAQEREAAAAAAAAKKK